MNTYPGNSHKLKTDEKPVEKNGEKKIKKVVKKPARTKKKSELRKFANEFIVDDVKNIKSYVISCSSSLSLGIKFWIYLK